MRSAKPLSIGPTSFIDRLGLGATFAILLYSSCMSGRAEQPSDPSLLISLDQETLSAKLNGAPLMRVLAEIGKRTDIEVYVVDKMQAQPIWADFKDLPLEEGIRRLLRGQSYTITHSPDIPHSHHITSISVLEQAANPGAAPSIDPAPTEEDQESEDAIAQKIDDLWQIVDQDPTQAKESLKKAIRDSSLEVRETALEVMSSMDHPFVGELLARVALKDSEPEMRIEALNLLADYNQEDILRDTLMKSIEDRDQDVREIAEHLLETLE